MGRNGKMETFDVICVVCGNQEHAEPCTNCGGWGYVLTQSGHDLLEFLHRLGFAVFNESKCGS